MRISACICYAATIYLFFNHRQNTTFFPSPTRHLFPYLYILGCQISQTSSSRWWWEIKPPGGAVYCLQKCPCLFVWVHPQCKKPKTKNQNTWRKSPAECSIFTDLLLTFHAAQAANTVGQHQCARASAHTASRQLQLHTSHATLVRLCSTSGRNSMFALLERTHDSPFWLCSGI